MPVKRYLFYISQNYSFAILRPVQEIIRQLGREVVWFVEGEQVNLDFFTEDETRLLSVEDVIRYNPEATLYPSNIVPTFLPGMNVAVFHGFDAGKVDKKGHNDHYKIRNCFDLYCTQGPDATEAFLELQKENPHFRVRETGWCALDPLFKDAPLNKSEESKPTILLCSTFSKKLSCAPILFETIKRLSSTGRWNWIVQFHPKMDLQVVKSYQSIESEFLRFENTDDVLPLLKEADVMVCDTSSVLLMFLLMKKPVVTFKNINPGNFLLDIDDPELLEKTITEALERPAKLMHNIHAFCDKTHPYTDGKSSARLLAAIDEVFDKPDSIQSKPLDIFRQLKMRKRLKYWKFW